MTATADTRPRTGSEARHVVLAAGGTGGHLFPAEAVARELLARGFAVTLITDSRGGGFGPELPQVAVERIAAGGLTGASPPAKLRSLASLALGYLQARRLLRQIAPAVVVGFGGYPSVPTVLAAAHQGRRVVIHEQNAVLGRANRLLAGRADVIATAFGEVEGLPPSLLERVRLTGNPVRPAIIEVGRRPYRLPGAEGRVSLLVIGGSQGAKVFNSLVPAAVTRLPEALRARLEVVQQVPADDPHTVAELYRANGVAAETAAFFADMPERLARAHLLICRAGASTVAELANAGRPAIMVPYPYHRDNQQGANAAALAEAGGGWVMVQQSLTAELLAERLRALLESPSMLARAAQCARQLAQPDAARRLAEVVAGNGDRNGDRDGGGSADETPQSGEEAAA